MHVTRGMGRKMTLGQYWLWVGCLVLGFAHLSFGKHRGAMAPAPFGGQFGGPFGGGGFGRGQFGGGMGMGGYGASSGGGNSGARQSAEKILEIGKTATQSLSQAADKFSEAVQKNQQSFQQQMSQPQPEEKSKLLEDLSAGLQKRQEASEKAPPVGSDLVKQILEGTGKLSDTTVDILKQKAIALQPEGPRPPGKQDSGMTLADRLRAYVSDRPSTRPTASQALVRADQIMAPPDAKIPSLEGDGHQHTGNGFHGGNTSRGMRGPAGHMDPSAKDQARGFLLKSLR